MKKLNRNAIKSPTYWITLILFGLSIWCAWPAITLQNFPHFPFVRGYGGMALMLVARTIAGTIKPPAESAARTTRESKGEGQ